MTDLTVDPRQYYDTEGEEHTLLWLCRHEPEWAENNIRRLERTLASRTPTATEGYRDRLIRFVCHLIDNCEGSVISEEYLHAQLGKFFPNTPTATTEGIERVREIKAIVNTAIELAMFAHAHGRPIDDSPATVAARRIHALGTATTEGVDRNSVVMVANDIDTYALKIGNGYSVAKGTLNDLAKRLRAALIPTGERGT